jgi:hypothetical protein
VRKGSARSKLHHRQAGEDGQPVVIDHPSIAIATDMVCAADAGSIATFIPGSAVPASLNGIAVTSWAAAASNQEGWSKVGGQ